VVEFRKAPVLGVIRLVQVSDERLVIEGTVDGLPSGHSVRIHIHEYGDLRNVGRYLGGIYQPSGDLGEMRVNGNQRGTVRLESNDLKIWHLIGRAMALTIVDDTHAASDANGFEHVGLDCNGNKIIAVALVARSSGLFENDKQVCLCSGLTLWQEDQLK
jgi:copper chaperone for superoxide dismutase